MSKHIGIAACSAEGAALCYRTICLEASVHMGEYMHPEVTMHTYPLGQYMIHVRAGNWEKVGDMMLSSVRKLAANGADFAICPDNTIHQGLPRIRDKSPIPWIHIAEAVGQEAKFRGFRQLGITGTKYLMTGPVYSEALRTFGISCQVPDEQDRERIDNIIFRELVNGVLREEARLYLNDVIKVLKDRGCDAVVLGCTEIPLLVKPDDCPLPCLDSTRLLARAALRRALGRERDQS